MKSPYAPIIHGAADDRPDERDTLVAAEAAAAALIRLGFDTEIIHLGLDFTPLARIAERRPHVVVNLVDALLGDDALFGVAPMLLEHLNLPFTGAGAKACAALGDKIETKRRIARDGAPTPDWWTDGDHAPPDCVVIVKSLTEHASIGLDARSIVPGARAGREIAAREARFGGKFFAEAYIDGREFNVSLLEHDGAPRVLPIPEILFDGLPEGRPRIVDYEAKWDETSAAYHATPRRFGLEAREPELAAELTRLSRICWRACELRGYARVDFRVGADGRPSVLEVNANPCLSPDAGFPAAALAAGLSYDAMIGRIVTAGADVRKY